MGDCINVWAKRVDTETDLPAKIPAGLDERFTKSWNQVSATKKCLPAKIPAGQK